MNTFCEHHNNSIKFGYRCFDRILLNGLIQPFQQPERVIGFFNAYREGNWPSCMPWYASLTSLPATLSPPPSFIPMCWLLFKFQPPDTLWLRFDTIYANSEPRTWSKNSQNRAAINSVHRAIPFALYSSNSSNPFTPRSLPAYSNLTGLTPNSRTTNEPSWIASIKKS